jgi:hypothetical protein
VGQARDVLRQRLGEAEAQGKGAAKSRHLRPDARLRQAIQSALSAKALILDEISI